jgi:hypothetical protein
MSGSTAGQYRLGLLGLCLCSSGMASRPIGRFYRNEPFCTTSDNKTNLPIFLFRFDSKTHLPIFLPNIVSQCSLGICPKVNLFEAISDLSIPDHLSKGMSSGILGLGISGCSLMVVCGRDSNSSDTSISLDLFHYLMNWNTILFDPSCYPHL